MKSRTLVSLPSTTVQSLFIRSIDYNPEARRMLIRKLEAEYGSNYPVCLLTSFKQLLQRIYRDYNLSHPTQSNLTVISYLHCYAQPKQQTNRTNRENILNDRSDGYVLPAGVRICFINSIASLRMECKNETPFIYKVSL